LEERILKDNENKIIYKEVRTYEEAYYYNSDPISRKNYDNSKEKIVKKEFKIRHGVLEFIGVAFEGALEILFSILD
jgi:hypothetical protein